MEDSQKTSEGLNQELAELREQLAQQEAEHRERVASLQQRTRELEERAKELACLHGISRLIAQPDLSPEELLAGIVELLPPAWQYPEICSARILVGDQEFRTAKFVETRWRQVQEITTDGQVVGAIDVCYLEERPEQEEGPFLRGERALLETIADLIDGAVQRYRDREALRQSEATAKGLLDAVTDRAMLIDREGVVLYVNEAMAERFGRSADELVGALARELVSAEVAEAEKQFFWDAVHGSETVRFEYERNGAWFENTFFPLLDAEKGVARIGVLARDVTHFKETEKALQQRVGELASVQRLGRRVGACLSPDEMVHVILEEVVSMVAPDVALLMLREGEDLLVKQIHSPDGAYAELGFPVHRVGECLCGQAVRDGRPIYVRDIHGDPCCTWEECKRAGLRSFAALPLYSRDTGIGVLGLASAAESAFDERASFLETIADQVAVALENARLGREAADLQVMREMDRLRSKLLADVSHELRTPLGLIKIFASTLLRADVVFDRETQVEFLRDIEDEADKLRVIVDNLLGMSRAESGRLRLAWQQVDLMSVVAKAVGTMKTQFLHHRFVQDLVAEPVMVKADVAMLDQVLRNLLDNAVKYSPTGSQITVVGRAKEGKALVQVIDEGMGIAEEHLGRIFERFYRVDNEITRRTRGIGLGLALCQEIVKAHGGLIWAESVPGEGSCFAFSLPLVSGTE